MPQPLVALQTRALTYLMFEKVVVGTQRTHRAFGDLLLLALSTLGLGFRHLLAGRIHHGLLSFGTCDKLGCVDCPLLFVTAGQQKIWVKEDTK